MIPPPRGVLVVNKHAGPTSHDVVAVARRTLGIRQVGHTGTLDPMAHGVLVLLVGGATAYQRALQGHRKVYDVTVRLGLETDTGDAWGRLTRQASVPELTPEQVAGALASCIGSLVQTPPVFSAVKVQGRPLYWWARRGQPRAAKPRTVQIVSMELIEWRAGEFRVRLACSAGTYVRTLAQTIAERLGTVGHVSHLTRLAVGPWTLEQAVDLCWLATASRADLLTKLQPVEAFLDAPAARA